MERGVVNNNAPLSHHFLQIAKAQGISQIPANTPGDNVDGIMQASESFSEQGHGQATLQKTNSMLPDCALMRQNPKSPILLHLLRCIGEVEVSYSFHMKALVVLYS